jgi:(2Fe-2S) ferredoxin
VSEKYPASLSIDTETPLWGTGKDFDIHFLCATGKTDWVHSVTDEEGTLAYALDSTSENWKLNADTKYKISNSSLAPPEEYFEHEGSDETRPSRLLILPKFVYIDNVTPETVAANVKPVLSAFAAAEKPTDQTIPELSKSLLSNIELPADSIAKVIASNELAYVLLCSHRTRDKRCAITANILKKKFDSELQALDLYRDPSDDRAGGVKVFCVSHVGGHKYAANVIIYTKSGQAIWLARVRPDHVRKIIQHCVLKGEVFPELLRAAFKSNPISW